MLEILARDNPDLEPLVATFLAGQRPLIVGGEPGHGKSLLIDAIASRHAQRADLPPLAVLIWDEVRRVYFRCLSKLVGDHIRPPDGSMSVEARELVSGVLRDAAVFALSHLSPKPLLIVETSLLGNRGERVVYDLPRWGYEPLILLVHNPAIWRRTVAAGVRPDASAAQIPAMVEIRRERLVELGAAGLTDDVQDRLLAGAWKVFLKGRDGLVVDWRLGSAEDERAFAAALQPAGRARAADVISPAVLRDFVGRHMQSVLAAAPPPPEMQPAERRDG